MSANAPCSCTSGGDATTTGSPFVRVRFQDGMLLAATDLAAEQAGHLGRHRLHQALLHGAGTVYGLRVDRSADGRQLQVGAGLAIDARGAELYVANTLCLRVDALSAATLEGFPGGVAWVVIQAESCPRDPVPALRNGCAEAPRTPAWSREVASVRVELVAEEPASPIAALRRFLEREGEADGAGRWLGRAPTPADTRALLLELALGDALPGDRARRYLESLWTGTDPLPLALARVQLGTVDGKAAVLADPDNAVRAILPGTQLLAELLYGVPLASGAVPLSRMEVTGVRVDAGAVEVAFSAPLEAASVTADAATLLAWDGAAWQPVPFGIGSSDRTLTLTPTTAPAVGQPVQIHLRGVGEHALLGAGGLPLAGDGGPSPLPTARDVVLVAAWS